MGLMTIEEAVARLARWTPVVGTEEVTLANAMSRVLSEDIAAPLPIAAHDNAAMDGFAFRFADLRAGQKMEVIGRVVAGDPMTGPLSAGKAVRIFTGGAMPAGSDTVAMQEDCEAANGMVLLPSHLELGANRRLAGEDVTQGSIVLTAGSRLRPQDIGIAAATGRARLPVRRRVRVAVLATGNELRAPGEPLPPGCIYDANRHAIAAALRGLGAEVTDLGLAPDRLGSIRDALATAASSHDLVISSGGMSAGDEDHVRPAVLEIGALDFWKLALKPGKPVAVGEVAGTPFVGLPGNPVSAMITFWLLARPLLLRLMGVADLSVYRQPVIADFHQHHVRGRREYLRVRVRRDAEGKLRAENYSSTSSGMLSSLVWSDGLVEVHEEKGDVEVGDVVDFLSYDTLLS
ncbi:MAG: Molybdopterin biosynthesis enzyme [Bradyrhizobium sp.]|nr:Molybdopterin biosynthesis enzyme [Bradyrhizobium sp.]